MAFRNISVFDTINLIDFELCYELNRDSHSSYTTRLFDDANNTSARIVLNCRRDTAAAFS